MPTRLLKLEEKILYPRLFKHTLLLETFNLKRLLNVQEPEFDTRYFLDSWSQNFVHNTLWREFMINSAVSCIFVQDSAHIAE